MHKDLMFSSLNQTVQRKFACPYRINQPQKYRSSNRDWRSCALTPLENVARVKGHLYRHHMIYPCQRCKEVFKNQQAISDSITNEIVEKLKSKKKSHRRGDGRRPLAEHLLAALPDAPAPSPYFELPSDRSELEEYEEYCHRELPLVVRAAIEEVVSRETQPLKEHLIAQLDSIIRIVQDRVSANYRSAIANVSCKALIDEALYATAPITAPAYVG
ncbi:hypothetical protein BKA65DRAFT_272413 [Rhexocercosporidium sp. MPI-PUGE-AT-0058]|nr:hypothetical protein BKA65DRAFT_272413 [Rhexocercosporidium sp. MPI-PUGE-AT-0058]